MYAHTHHINGHDVNCDYLSHCPAHCNHTFESCDADVIPAQTVVTYAVGTGPVRTQRVSLWHGRSKGDDDLTTIRRVLSVARGVPFESVIVYRVDEPRVAPVKA